jgi:hypothetical protein
LHSVFSYAAKRQSAPDGLHPIGFNEKLSRQLLLRDISDAPPRVFRAAPETASRILNGKCRLVKKTPKNIRNVI